MTKTACIIFSRTGVVICCFKKRQVSAQLIPDVVLGKFHRLPKEGEGDFPFKKKKKIQNLQVFFHKNVLLSPQIP